MIRTILIWFMVLSLPANADKYEVWARDFIVIRARTEACMDAAMTHADAVACAGRATSACLAKGGDWPHPGPRDCSNEGNVWEAIYKVEQMKNLQTSHAMDLNDLYYDRAIYGSRMDRTMEAEHAWRSYADGQCRVEGLTHAEKSYDAWKALPPDWCLERMFAERIFYLRSERNWLGHYRR